MKLIKIQGDNEVDGNLYLSMDEDDILWDDLKLQSEDKALLNECPPKITLHFYKKFFEN